MERCQPHWHAGKCKLILHVDSTFIRQKREMSDNSKCSQEKGEEEAHALPVGPLLRTPALSGTEFSCFEYN